MRVVVAEQVYLEQIDDETILLELQSGQYFGLNAVASRLWQLLAELGSTDAVIEAATQEYNVHPEDLKRDLEDLLRELATRKLVVLHETAPSE